MDVEYINIRKNKIKELYSKMKWDDEKIAILQDGYAFSDLDELANIIGTTKKSVIRKAQRLRLRRAKNNQIFDGYKFCSFCKIEHPVDEFYKNKSKFDGLEYHCKRYYELKKVKLNHFQTTPPLSDLRASVTEYLNLSTLEHIKHRPQNPVVFRDGVPGKVCNQCKIFKPLDDYSKDQNGIAGCKATCKSCYKERYSQKRE